MSYLYFFKRGEVFIGKFISRKVAHIYNLLKIDLGVGISQA